VLKKNSKGADRKGGKKDDPWLGTYIVERSDENGTYVLAKNGHVNKVSGVNAQLKQCSE
jgi:hypothetical protein